MRHHAAGLRRLTKNPQWVQQLIDKLDEADLDARQRAMLQYAIKLTKEPAKMVEADVENLRQHNLDDRAILDVNLVCGYFAFVNRLADGLGVPLEDYWENEPNP